MPRFRVTTIVGGRNFYEVGGPDVTRQIAEDEVYSYLDGNTSGAIWVSDDMDVESIASVEKVEE